MKNRVFSRIKGTGTYLPERVVSNDEVASLLGLPDEDVFRVTGIKARHWCHPEQTCSDLAAEAARRALSAADLSIEAVDAILVSTTSPDTIFPSTACYLQQKLKARPVAAFDLAASCTGFLYGLSMADSFIRSGQYRCCLVVAAEVKSRYLDGTRKSSAMLFGDGAGAAVMVRDEGIAAADSNKAPGILGIRLYSDGAYRNLITVPAGGSKLPGSAETVENHLHAIELKGSQVFRTGVKRLSVAFADILREFDLKVSDITQVIAHQANARMLRAIANRARLAPTQMFSMIEQVGNTSSASLPIALDAAQGQHKFAEGDLILLGAFGGGLTWGTALIRW
ncbi:ketoacyl-ACP synthase III [Candidatus Nitronereus thalassa]|uniref:Ketoacyl-ACP synthase III n=1 Tax=Candidatus Nitronereus thalassa TaxID=3020898 RepID=A0ABU3K7Z9_9BACT|nr:ketoacyl-ACP synthase III [Candidatus Nitronereus thalassa]MDT7042569.1 ketoacyl-ACP synthase III [Candidatus Nitronereus thalassa]